MEGGRKSVSITTPPRYSLAAKMSPGRVGIKSKRALGTLVLDAAKERENEAEREREKRETGLFSLMLSKEVLCATDLRQQLDMSTPWYCDVLSPLYDSHLHRYETCHTVFSEEEDDDSQADTQHTQRQRITLETFPILDDGFDQTLFECLPSLGVTAMVAYDYHLYYIRKNCIERVQLEQPPEGFASNNTAQSPEQAAILNGKNLAWDLQCGFASKSITLLEGDSLARPKHQSTQGTVVGHRSHGEGVHSWNILAAGIDNLTVGVVSKLGTDNFHPCRIGALPVCLTSMKPGSTLDHRLYWSDPSGHEVSQPLSTPLKDVLHEGQNIITIIVNFFDQQVVYLCNGITIGTLVFKEPFIGEHTVFAHLKNGTQVQLVNKIHRLLHPLSAVLDDLPSPNFHAGNPYVRWGHVDGLGDEAAFVLPLGMCEYKSYLWVTDTTAVRRVDARGMVTTFYPVLTPCDCQGPIQYLGTIHPMRNKFYINDLTNKTILCVDPITWEAEIVLDIGEHGFRPCSDEERAELATSITRTRIDDVINDLLPSAVAVEASDILFTTLVGAIGLAHVPPAWLFVADCDTHCVYLSDQGKTRHNTLRNCPQVCAGMPREPGKIDGSGFDARFRSPTCLVGDPENLLLYLSDTGNSRIAKIQLVWNDTRRSYSANVTTIHHTKSNGENEQPIKICNVEAITLQSDFGNCLLALEPVTSTVYQVQLQAALPARGGATFSSPYDQLVVMLKQAKRDAENMPQINVEHCKGLGRSLDLLMSTPNIYQVEYVGCALDDDVARFLSDTYAPQGVGWEEEEDPLATRTPSQVMRRRSTSLTKPPPKPTHCSVRFGEGTSSRALGLDIPDLDSLSFDVFEISRLSEDAGGVLVQVAINIFSKYRFFTKYFGTPELVHRLIQFLSKIQAGYRRENPYHTHIHAADVLQTVHWLINTANIVEKMSDVDCLSVLLSAVIHDYDHPGVNNAFLVNTRDEIALHFNDQSVLENHHLFQTFQLLQVETYSILETLSDHEQKILREHMINHVLGTDMKVHFKALGELKARATTLRDEGGDFMTSVDDRMLMLKSLLHAADISNPTKPLSMYLEWTKRVMKEFREQGKREEESELVVSPFCDADADVSRCQKGFVEYVVKPLFVILHEAYPSFKPLLDNLDANLLYWKDMENTTRQGSFKRRRSSVM